MNKLTNIANVRLWRDAGLWPHITCLPIGSGAPLMPVMASGALGGLTGGSMGTGAFGSGMGGVGMLARP